MLPTHNEPLIPDVTDSNRLSALTVSLDLSRLEKLLNQFNIFEAVGVARQELRHSDFLAFLLDPSQPHGLGAAFIKRLLRRLREDDETDEISVDDLDLDGWSLDQSSVHRERYNIDICFANDEHRLAVIFENKIGTGEHSGQLHRYLEIARTVYPGWTILPIFLSPTGLLPKNASYLPMSYTDVARTLEELADERQRELDPAAYVLMTHYVRMLRRHVVTDAETAELCHRIYRQHRRAIDLIIAHRPDRLTEIREFLIGLIQATPEVEFENSPKLVHVQFATPAWDRPWLQTDPTWVVSGRILLFQFNNHEDFLGLHLLVGHGPIETRQALIARASAMTPPFRVFPSRGRLFAVIYEKTFLTHASIGDVDMHEIERRIQDAWGEFVERELPALISALNVDEMHGVTQK